jgi:formyltetrahydrofolate synthetase
MLEDYPAQAFLIKVCQVHLVIFAEMIFPGVKKIVDIPGVVQVPERIAITESNEIRGT